MVEEYFQCLGNSVDSLDEALIHVVSQASELYSQFWAEVEHHGGFATSSFSITKDKDGYRIRWINLTKVKGQGGPSGKVKAFSLPYGKKNGYLVSQIKPCELWMETLFLKYEPKLYEIRLLIKSNRELRSKIIRHINTTRKNYPDLEL